MRRIARGRAGRRRHGGGVVVAAGSQQRRVVIRPAAAGFIDVERSIGAVAAGVRPPAGGVVAHDIAAGLDCEAAARRGKRPSRRAGAAQRDLLCAARIEAAAAAADHAAADRPDVGSGRIADAAARVGAAGVDPVGVDRLRHRLIGCGADEDVVRAVGDVADGRDLRKLRRAAGAADGVAIERVQRDVAARRVAAACRKRGRLRRHAVVGRRDPAEEGVFVGGIRRRAGRRRKRDRAARGRRHRALRDAGGNGEGHGHRVARGKVDADRAVRRRIDREGIAALRDGRGAGGHGIACGIIAARGAGGDDVAAEGDRAVVRVIGGRRNGEARRAAGWRHHIGRHRIRGIEPPCQLGIVDERVAVALDGLRNVVSLHLVGVNGVHRAPCEQGVDVLDRDGRRAHRGRNDVVVQQDARTVALDAVQRLKIGAAVVIACGDAAVRIVRRRGLVCVGIQLADVGVLGVAAGGVRLRIGRAHRVQVALHRVAAEGVRPHVLAVPRRRVIPGACRRDAGIEQLQRRRASLIAVGIREIGLQPVIANLIVIGIHLRTQRRAQGVAAERVQIRKGVIPCPVALRSRGQRGAVHAAHAGIVGVGIRACGQREPRKEGYQHRDREEKRECAAKDPFVHFVASRNQII